MYCNQCGNRNPYGSKFCRHCGASLTLPGAARKIPDEEYAVAPETGPPGPDAAGRTRELLDQAFLWSEKGDLTAAIRACEEAIVADPGRAAAHSFLALLYERAGEAERAIDAYQSALKLNPDSTLDRDSLSRLRRKSHGSMLPRHRPRRSTPYFDTTPVVAAATFAIVLLLSVHHYVNGRTLAEAEARRVALRASEERARLAQAPSTATPNRFLAQGQQRGPGLLPNQRPLISPPLAQSPLTSVPSEQLPVMATPPPGPGTGQPNPPQNRWLDVPTGGGRARPSGTPMPPIDLTGGSSGAGSAFPPPRRNPADTQPAVTGRPPAPTGAGTGTGTAGNAGYIRVTVSKAPAGVRRAEGGAESDSTPLQEAPRAPSHERIANQLFLQGDLDGAIDNYRKALETTSAELLGPLHQQLAGAYLRKKMTAEAVAEYRRALDAYRLQKNSGIQVAHAEKGIRACQDAINTWEPFLR